MVQRLVCPSPLLSPLHALNLESRSRTFTFHVKVCTKILSSLCNSNPMLGRGNDWPNDSPKFYSVPSTPMPVTLNSRSRTLTIYSRFCVKIFENLKSSDPFVQSGL